MKKFLLAAALVFSVVTGQFAQAQDYTPQEGDKAIICTRRCLWCYRSYNEAKIYRNKQLIVEDEAPVYGCSSSYSRSYSRSLYGEDGRHNWSNQVTLSYYIFTGGQWQEVKGDFNGR